MELRHVAWPRRAQPASNLFGRLRPVLGLLLLAGCLQIWTAPALGQVRSPLDGNPVGTPKLVSKLHTPPAGGFTLNAEQALAIARSDPRVRAKLRDQPGANAYVYTRVFPTWQVSWFSPGKKAHEVIQVYVDDGTRRVTQVWTGFQIAWAMARGYPGAFGRRSNALYVWLPLCFLFLAPFLPWSRLRRRRASGLSPPARWRLLHLDLVMLLGFSISLALFNHGQIGLSVPLVYPFLIYLLARMLLLAFGHGAPREPFAVTVPVPWLLSGAVFLIGLRIGLNIMNSNVIDVGYAGVIGANKVLHSQILYGFWPHDNAYGDTYGPVNYLAYVPFRLIFGWSGAWDSLPASHAAAICFDLLTVGGLYLLGRRIRGHALGVLLMYAWVAYPFTLFSLSSNSNDALVSATVVLALLVLASAPARGVAAALAGMTKFAPFALAPLLLRGIGAPPKERDAAWFIVAFALTLFVVMQPVLLNGDLNLFWHDSIVYQADRVTPFSVWGLWGGLGFLQHLIEGAAAGLAVVVAFVPRQRGMVQVAALGAAVLIAVELSANYWLYPYILWFLPLVLVALLASHFPRAALTDPPAAEELSAAQPDPVPAL